uniref:Uncharacterized protein n=1 Tax=Palpitomonas bilix TaxID=652834 RepID=A0A7S3DJX8_9EUKA|mmetsp:Transcript_41341/g.107052  ORF Transcript_41341/g.107052 Transcript_41341/m.107052 type:complete len:138 (+) Transcript_41341:860-1273(+)
MSGVKLSGICRRDVQSGCLEMFPRGLAWKFDFDDVNGIKTTGGIIFTFIMTTEQNIFLSFKLSAGPSMIRAWGGSALLFLLFAPKISRLRSTGCKQKCSFNDRVSGLPFYEFRIAIWAEKYVNIILLSCISYLFTLV